VLGELAERDDLSARQIRELVDRGGSAIAIGLLRRGRLAPADIPRADVRVVITAVEEGTLSADLIADAVHHRDPAIRAALAECPDLPRRLLALLAGDPDVEVAEAAALSPALTDEVAATLAGHPHLAVRRGLAANDRTPPHILAAVATDSGVRWCFGCDGSQNPRPGMACAGTHEDAVWDLHYALAANDATPAPTAAIFADHRSAVVRRNLAARTDQTDAIYQWLAADLVPGVRAETAGNPAISEALIRTMADDRTHDVQRRLVRNPAVPLDVLQALTTVTRIGPGPVPRIAIATAGELEVLARSPNPIVRMLVAERRDLPPHLVDLLAGDPDAKVLKSLAPNPMLTERQLRAMLTEHGVRTAARIATNPNCPPALLDDLAIHRPRVQKVYRAIATHPNATARALLHCLDDPQARPLAARHPALPTDVLVTLLDDPESRVAESAAANPSLPGSVVRSILDRLDPPRET